MNSPNSLRRALLIDDEPPARAVLRDLLAAHPAITVVGEAGRFADAQARLAHDDYDVVFLDIQLRGGTGFDLVPHVRLGARIVFVTAHDAHALRAFTVNALDYLVKPVAPARLADTVARALDSPVPAIDDARWRSQGWRSDDTVFVRLNGGSRAVPLRELVALGSNENYTVLDLASGERLLVRHTLRAWEDALPRPPFVRVHRQALVNLARLTRVEDDGGGAPLLHLTGGRTPVRISRREWPAVRALLPRTGVVAAR